MSLSPMSNDIMPKLGDLEIAVLEHVWVLSGATAKSTHAAIGVCRNISPNTVQSAMERLYRKGLLEREKSGHSYQYTAAVEREALIARLIGSVLGRFGGDAPSAIAAFIESSEDIDPEELERLEAILRQRREGLER